MKMKIKMEEQEQEERELHHFSPFFPLLSFPFSSLFFFFGPQAVQGVLAIGTTHGLIVIYDIKQNMIMMLGSSSQSTQYGAVTAINLSYDNSRLLAGHERGQVLQPSHFSPHPSVLLTISITLCDQIVRWDLTSGKILNQMTDIYPQSTHRHTHTNGRRGGATV
jgi:hypothetical protein